jgi:hypothetical protein
MVVVGHVGFVKSYLPSLLGDPSVVREEESIDSSTTTTTTTTKLNDRILEEFLQM